MPNDPKHILRHLAPRKEQRLERWCFTQYELENPEMCFSDDPLVAYLGRDENDVPISTMGVIVLRNGLVTHKWEDGTIGVPEECRRLAGDVEVLTKPIYYGSNIAYNEDDEVTVKWKNVWVGEQGRFNSWYAGDAGYREESAREALEHVMQ